MHVNYETPWVCGGKKCGLELSAVIMTSDDSYAYDFTLLDGFRIIELMFAWKV